MIVAGVDEVGRGPLAGAVVVAAVILSGPIDGLADSKKLTPRRRQQLAKEIEQKARCFSYGRAEVDEIDKLNIHHATLLAMSRAIEGLTIKPDKVLIDGAFIPRCSIPCEAIVKGDTFVDEISAASILAKVMRDEEMLLMDKLYPGYGFAAHKGYPTRQHREAILTHGVCPIHRRSYAPIAALIP